MTTKQRIHNEYFRTVSLSHRKSCPTCKEKLLPGESIWSWGEYIFAKWRTVRYFCKCCYPEVQRDLTVHREECGCDFNLIMYGGEQQPEWLELPECTVSK